MRLPSLHQGTPGRAERHFFAYIDTLRSASSMPRGMFEAGLAAGRRVLATRQGCFFVRCVSCYKQILSSGCPMKPWILLVVAGILETGWAIGLKYTDGFTRLGPSLLTALALIASMVLLALAVRDLPIGTAYPVWVGIGAAGTALIGIGFLGESASPWRLLFLVLLVVAIIGLKWTASAPTS